MSTQMLPQPTLPGYVHGIVSIDPPTVQCDGCGVTSSKHHRLTLAILISGIIFCPRLYASGEDRRRLCAACRREAGWPS